MHSKKYMWPLINLIRLTISILVLVPWCPFVMIVGLIDQTVGIKLIRLWIKFLLNIFKIRILVDNENEPTQQLTGCIFTLLNQTSLFDGAIGGLVYPLPFRGITNIEYTLIPFFGWWTWIFCWVIIRQMPNQAKRTLNKAVAFLQSGGNIWMSIEGRRSTNGTLSPYKKGPIVLAITAQAKIVPIIIYGAKDCFGLHSCHNKHTKVIVRLLKAIPTDGLKYEDRTALVAQLFKIGEKAIAQYHERLIPNNANSVDL